MKGLLWQVDLYKEHQWVVVDLLNCCYNEWNALFVQIYCGSLCQRSLHILFLLPNNHADFTMDKMPTKCSSLFFVKYRGLVGWICIAYLLLSSQIHSSMQSVKKCQKKLIGSETRSRLISVISSLQGTFSVFEVWKYFHWTVFDCFSFFHANGSGLTWISS